MQISMPKATILLIGEIWPIILENGRIFAVKSTANVKYCITSTIRMTISGGKIVQFSSDLDRFDRYRKLNTYMSRIHHSGSNFNWQIDRTDPRLNVIRLRNGRRWQFGLSCLILVK